jgi:hypothetical protein
MRKSMYSALAVLISMCFSTDAGAQTFICVDCRGAFLHPKDFGNFVFNAFWGAKPSLGIPGAPNHTNPVKVSNLRGQVVEVVVPIPINMFPWPDNVVELMVIKPNGVVERYEVSSSRLGQDLPIGPSNGPGGTGGGAPGGGGRSAPGSGGGPGGPSGPGGGGRCGTSEIDGDSGTRRRTCS